jgi:putative transcriptional regulator
VTIRYHPDDALLLDHAAGTLGEGVGLAVAVHLAFCAECRLAVARLDVLGGALLEGMAPVAMDPNSLDAVYGRITRLEGGVAERPARADMPDPHDGLPYPLRPYAPGGLRSLAWRRAGRLRKTALPLAGRGPWRASLLRMTAGAAVPAHTHAGSEYTVVLQGGYTDETGDYAPGDFAFADPNVRHRPKADPGEDCIVLAVQDAPIRFAGPLLRFLNPVLR